MRGRGYSLKRRQAQREPRRKFFIFCEGGNTEPGYFNAIRRKYREALIEINTIGPVGVPKTVAKRAVAQKNMAKSRSLNSFEERDEVWAVFDRDEHGCYYEAIGMCRAAGVGVARSNPCFELWLILHEQDFDKPLGRGAVAKHLRKVRPDYDPDSKVLNFDDIITKMEQAETRAGRQMKARIREAANPLGPPYTTVALLTASIRKAAKESL